MPDSHIRRLIMSDFPDMNQGEFKPCAHYCKYIDALFVIFRDCRMTEIRFSPYTCVLEDNYSEEGKDKFVGFRIDCLWYLAEHNQVQHISTDSEFKPAGKHKLTDFLSKLRNFPDECMEFVIDRFLAKIKEHDIEIDFSKPSI